MKYLINTRFLSISSSAKVQCQRNHLLGPVFSPSRLNERIFFTVYKKNYLTQNYRTPVQNAARLMKKTANVKSYRRKRYL